MLQPEGSPLLKGVLQVLQQGGRQRVVQSLQRLALLTAAARAGGLLLRAWLGEWYGVVQYVSRQPKLAPQGFEVRRSLVRPVSLAQQHRQRRACRVSCLQLCRTRLVALDQQAVLLLRQLLHDGQRAAQLPLCLLQLRCRACRGLQHLAEGTRGGHEAWKVLQSAAQVLLCCFQLATALVQQAKLPVGRGQQEQRLVRQVQV
jgi:hypothetical protein